MTPFFVVLFFQAVTILPERPLLVMASRNIPVTSGIRSLHDRPFAGEPRTESQKIRMLHNNVFIPIAFKPLSRKTWLFNHKVEKLGFPGTKTLSSLSKNWVFDQETGFLRFIWKLMSIKSKTRFLNQKTRFFYEKPSFSIEIPGFSPIKKQVYQPKLKNWVFSVEKPSFSVEKNRVFRPRNRGFSIYWTLSLLYMS